MSKSNISEIVSSLLSGVHGISTSETIVGAPQKAGDAIVIPVHRLKIAFGAASANAGAQGARVGGSSGGQGAGGAVELEPVAAITVDKHGQARLLTVDGGPENPWAALVAQVPELVTRLTQALGERLPVRAAVSAPRDGEERIEAEAETRSLPGREA
ncbi:MAG TPA: spore germination protein GerW family protein [Polyangiaceae bacterium]|nr:spore germination protein GerW family protein [Polyangiaceae bacterium]